MRRLGLKAVAPAWAVLPLTVFVVTRLFDVLLLVLAAHQETRIRAGSPVMRQVWPEPPSYWTVITSWDGGWYRAIVESGYPASLPISHGGVAQNPWAFFPLYPGLVKLVMAATSLPFGPAASAVSVLSAALGVMLIYRLLHETGGPFVALASTVALCTFMAAPAFQMAYTEGTALLLLALALWCLRRQRYGPLILVVLAVSLTRPIVIPLAVVIGLHWLARWRRRSGEEFPLRERFTAALATFVAVASAAIWPTVAAFVTGRPNAFSATQAAWGNTPDRSWLIAGLTVKSPGFLVLVAIGALLPVLLAARPPARKWGSDWRAWLIAYAVYLLVAGRPSPSLIRYAMLAVVPWWPLPELGTDVLNNPRGAARWLTLAGLAVIGLWCQYVWIQHFVLITGPSRHYYP